MMLGIKMLKWTRISHPSWPRYNPKLDDESNPRDRVVILKRGLISDVELQCNASAPDKVCFIHGGRQKVSGNRGI